MALLRKRLTDAPESERDSTGYRLARLVRLLLVFLAPVAALIMFFTALTLVRVRSIRWWWIALPAGAVTAVGLWFFGWGPMFWTGWREVVAAMGAASMADWSRVALSTTLANWPNWILAQVPLSVPLGITVGAAVAARRLLRSPAVMREDKNTDIPYKEQVAKLAKLDLWPQPEKKPATSALASMANGQAVMKRIKDNPALLTTREPERPWRYKELLARFGVTADGKAFDVLIAALARQMLIDGPSGAGKTTFIIEYIRALLEAPATRSKRFPLIFLTMKPAWDITEAVAGICERTGRTLHIVTENGRRDATTRYNPIGRGNAFEVAEYVLATEHARNPFNQTFFQEGSTAATTLAVRALFELVEKGQQYKYGGTMRVFRRDLWHLAYLHNLTVLKQFNEFYSDELKDSLGRFLTMAEDAPVMNQFCVEMATRLSNLVESEAANVVAWDEEGLDLEQAIENGDVVLFNLDPMQQPRAATSLGFYAIQELTALCAHFGLSKWGMEGRSRERTIFFLIDEFSALGGSQLGTLYDRSRSYGFGIGLSFQHLKTLEVIGEDFKTSVIKNSNIKVLFRQDEDAETYAGIMGTRISFKETQQTLEDVDLLGSQMIASGQGSIREVNEFIISPDTLRGLRDGQACFLVASETFGAERRINVVTLRNTDPEPAALPAPLSSKAKATPAPAPVPTPAVAPEPEDAEPELLEFYLTAAQCAARISERLDEKTTTAAFQKMVIDREAPAPARSKGNTQKWAQTVIDAWLDERLAARSAATTSTTTAAEEQPTTNTDPVHRTDTVSAVADTERSYFDADEDMPEDDDEGPAAPEAPDEELTEPAYK